jgi:hypothetical protein
MTFNTSLLHFTQTYVTAYMTAFTTALSMNQNIYRTKTVRLEYVPTTSLDRFEIRPRMYLFLNLNAVKETIESLGIDRKSACITRGNRSYLLSTLVPAYLAYAKKINS